jgi:hypothetical protein
MLALHYFVSALVMLQFHLVFGARVLFPSPDEGGEPIEVEMDFAPRSAGILHDPTYYLYTKYELICGAIQKLLLLRFMYNPQRESRQSHCPELNRLQFTSNR